MSAEKDTRPSYSSCKCKYPYTRLQSSCQPLCLDTDKFVVQRIHLRNEAKTATLEKLVPHLGTLEATRNQLREAKELARKTEHDLRDRIVELQDSNFELSGSSKGKHRLCLTCFMLLSMCIWPMKSNTVQASKISELEKRIQALEKDKAELAKQRDSALKDVEGTGS